MKTKETTAKQKEVKVSDLEVVTLSKPLTMDGIKYTTLELRLGELTGEDLEAAEMQVRSEGIDINTAHELCKPFLLAVAARAARINRNYLLQLSIKDASKVTLLVQGFLLN